jgi:hypothetical protein
MGTKNAPTLNDCYNKAWPDEELFTLIARDPLMPRLIELWVFMRQGGYVPDRYKPNYAALLDSPPSSKEAEAILCAENAKKWFLEHGDPRELAPALPVLVPTEMEPPVRKHKVSDEGVKTIALSVPSGAGRRKTLTRTYRGRYGS